MSLIPEAIVPSSSKVTPGDNIRQTSGLWWLDQIGVCPRLAQHMRVVKFQTVQVVLDGAPRLFVKYTGKIVGQLRIGQIIDPIVKIRTDATDSASVGVNGFRL